MSCQVRKITVAAALKYQLQVDMMWNLNHQIDIEMIKNMVTAIFVLLDVTVYEDIIISVSLPQV